MPAKNSVSGFLGNLASGFLTLLVVAGVLYMLLWLSGCGNLLGIGGLSSPPDGNEGGYLEPVEQVQEDPEPPPLPVGAWSCEWSPTMNEDWHDDVLCSNGVASDRPILLPDWGFVSQDDMMAEAQRYEDYLNSQ